MAANILELACQCGKAFENGYHASLQQCSQGNSAMLANLKTMLAAHHDPHHHLLPTATPHSQHEVLPPQRQTSSMKRTLTYRLLGCLDGLHHWLQLLDGGGRGQAADVAADGHLLLPVRHAQLLLNVLGHIHQHRA